MITNSLLDRMQSEKAVQEMLASWARLKQVDAEVGIRHSMDWMAGSGYPAT